MDKNDDDDDDDDDNDLPELCSSASQITKTSNFFSFGLDTNWDCTVE